MPKTPNPMPMWARIIQKGLVLYFVAGMSLAAGLAHQTLTGEPVVMATIEGGAA